jgi:putative FmdB family regulatory protein
VPLYEYYCIDCHSAFDTFRPMNRADDPIACEHCGGDHTNRVLSRFAVVGGDGGTVTGASSSGSCASCSGGHCSSCGH